MPQRYKVVSHETWLEARRQFLRAKGRDEAGHGFPQFWVRRHDEYDRRTGRR